MHTIISSALLLLCCALPAKALELTAVSPSTVYPGSSVTLSGGPFTEGVMVLVGDLRVSADSVDSRRIVFTVPVLAAGEYALAVEQEGARSLGPFILRVVQAPPRISSLDPAVLDVCGGSDNRTVTVEGSNFSAGATLLFDNAAVDVDRLATSEIVFTLLTVTPGLHQVQVINSDNQKSLPRGFVVKNTPEISDIEVGADRVVEYELLIHGKNFNNNSQVLLNGTTIPRDSGVITTTGPNRDAVRYLDCTTLVYLRRPVAREARELEFQIANPGGAQSNIYRITTP